MTQGHTFYISPLTHYTGTQNARDTEFPKVLFKSKKNSIFLSVPFPLFEFVNLFVPNLLGSRNIPDELTCLYHPLRGIRSSVGLENFICKEFSFIR